MHGASIFSQISIKNHRLMKYVNIEIDPKRTVISLNTPEIHELLSGIPMIIKQINLFANRPGLHYSRIRQVLLDHTLHGNISISLGKWLYMGNR